MLGFPVHHQLPELAQTHVQRVGDYGLAGKESACNVGYLGSSPWVGKIPWRRERLPIPVFWPGEFHGLYSP